MNYFCNISASWRPTYLTFDHIFCILVVQCGSPRNGTNTVPIPANRMYFYTSSYTYQCIDGYMPAGDMTVTCESDGTWSNLNAVCIGVYYDFTLFQPLTIFFLRNMLNSNRNFRCLCQLCKALYNKKAPVSL